MVRPPHRTVPEEEDAGEGGCAWQGEEATEKGQRRKTKTVREYLLIGLHPRETALVASKHNEEWTLPSTLSVLSFRMRVGVVLSMSLLPCGEDSEALECRRFGGVAENCLLYHTPGLD